MRDITKLLESIPLDQLTGDDNMSKPEIKVKSHAPAMIAVAACAALVCTGAVFMLNQGGKTAEKDSAVSPKAAVTDAQSLEETPMAEDPEADPAETTVIHTDPVPPEAVQQDNTGSYSELTALYNEAVSSGDFSKLNEEIFRVQDEKYLIDFDAAKSTKHFFSEQIGGADGNLDLWVADYSYSYPFLRVYVAAATKDGSPLEDAIPDECSFDAVQMTINGFDTNHYGTGYFEKYGSVGMSSIIIYLDDMEFEPSEEPSDVTIEMNGLRGRNLGSTVDDTVTAKMSAAFKAELSIDNTVISDLNVPGSWDNKYTNEWHFAADYTVKKVAYNDSGMAITVEGSFKNNDMQQALFWSENAVAVKTRSIPGLDNSDITNNCDLTGTNAFVSVIREDGSICELEITDYKVVDDGANTKTIFLDMSTFGLDLTNAKSLMIGSAEIDF